MRKIIEEINVYTYNELPKEAKGKVKEWYLTDDSKIQEFLDICNNDLENLFCGDLQVQFSLGYCQGDGVNIYGLVHAKDIIKCLDEHKGGALFAEFENALSDKEKRIITHYEMLCEEIDLLENRRYDYSLSDRINIVDCWGCLLENSMYKNINYTVLEKFEELVRNIFTKLCRKYEEYGYSFFYAINDDELSEICNCNGWEFYADGGLFI